MADFNSASNEKHPPTREPADFGEILEVGKLMDTTLANFERLAELRGLTVSQEIENALDGVNRGCEQSQKDQDFDPEIGKLYGLTVEA